MVFPELSGQDPSHGGIKLLDPSLFTTALWEYKGGQEDIRNISGKTHRKPPTKKCIKFTDTFY